MFFCDVLVTSFGRSSPQAPASCLCQAIPLDPYVFFGGDGLPPLPTEYCFYSFELRTRDNGFVGEGW